MHIINKVVGFLLNPLVTAAVLGVATFVCYRLRRCRVAKWLAILAVVWLWVWSIPLTVRIVGAPLELEFLVDGRVPAVESFPSADAIVLLGGSVGAETNLSSCAEMFSSADRVWQAARLFKAKKATRIVATGEFVQDSTLGLLNDFGVPKENVEFLDARNTEEEARGCAKLEYKKIVLVTSAWHMKRARLMFKKYAPEVEVICAPADFENSMMAARPFSLRELFPDHNASFLNYIALHEWVGIAGYKLVR